MEDIMEFNVGDTHHFYMPPGGYYKLHICAIIDEEYVVYKWYGKHKQWWHYQIEHMYIIDAKIKRALELKEKGIK